jgi:ABC-type polysaccharide/polyol phosphate export permease
MGFFLVMKAEMVRTFIIMRRYWFRTITGMIIGYAILLMFVLGVMANRQVVEQSIQDMTRGQDATNWALGFIIGMFAFGIIGMFTQGLQELAQSGQLEQLCMSPHGLVTNFMARTVVTSISNILTSALMIWLISRSVKGTLHADFVPTVTLLALTYSNLIGFGFMFGGLVLVFKQTGQIAMVVRLGIFGVPVLASERVEQLPILLRIGAHAVPVTDAAICIKYVLIQGQMAVNDAGEEVFRSVFTHPSFYYLLVNCVFWTIVGVACFRLMEDWSRSKGTLGAY